MHQSPQHPCPLQALPWPCSFDGAALRQRTVRLPRLRRDALLPHRHDESRSHQTDTRFWYTAATPQPHPLVHPDAAPRSATLLPDLVSSYRKPPGWSSYSEVAAYWGGKGGNPVPILLSGKDFGSLVDVPPAVLITSKGQASSASRKPGSKRWGRE